MMTSMSQSWVRGQRHLRRKGEDHVFDLDPICVGKTPVYQRDAVLEWIDRMASTNAPA